MNEIEERARSQLMVIEQVQSIRIRNRDEVTRLIAEMAMSTSDVMAVCTSLNLWIAINGLKRDVTIPRAVIASAFKEMKRQ